MTPERWKQISRLYEDARLRAASDRVAFLAEACGGDASLQREVQALLDQPTSPKGLEGLTPSVIAEAIGNDDDHGGLTGRRFGVYVGRTDRRALPGWSHPCRCVRTGSDPSEPEIPVFRANGRGPFTRRSAPGVQRAKGRTPAALSAYARSTRVHPDCGNRQQQQPVLLTRRPVAWVLDGQTLLFTEFVDGGVWEIRALSRTGGDRKVHPSRNAAVNERYPQFSPDGEWFVYSSNERGEEEVFVERYRGAAERYQISTNGGTAPAWAPSGREVFYVAAAPEGRISMMAVDVTLSPKFTAGRPHALFEGRYGVGTPHRHYDVSRDGRFLMVRGPEGPPSPPVTQMVLVLNWFEELKRLAPSDR
jgi:WD40 repeat protein